MLALISLLAFIVSASFYDLRERRIPDQLNYFFLFLAFAINLVNSAFSLEFLIFAFLPLVLLSFGFAYLLYKIGAWAGGDVKFFTALCAFLPIFGPFGAFSFIYVFFASVITLLPVMFAIYFRDFIGLRGEIAGLFLSSLSKGFGSAIFSSAVFLFVFISNVFFPSPLLVVALVLASFFVRLPWKASAVLLVALLAVSFDKFGQIYPSLAFILLLSILLLFAKGISSLLFGKVLRKEVKISAVREGMIPAFSIVRSGKKAVLWNPSESYSKMFGVLASSVAGKISASELPSMLNSALLPKGNVVANALLARGLSKDEIKELKRLKLKSIVIKESLPFTPVISAGFLLYLALRSLI